MSAYINRLKQASEQTQTSHDDRGTPEQKFDRWWADQPRATRQHPYTLAEISAATGVIGRILSSVMVDRGWQRKRQWQGTAHYYRLWVPPKGSDRQVK